MEKAFIFDWDGVLIQSEQVWTKLEREAWPRLFGQEISDKMPDLVGAGLNGVLVSAASLGATFDKEDIIAAYDDIAKRVYARSALSPGIDTLIESLREQQFKIGIVSQSARSWLNNALHRLSFLDMISIVITLPEHPELRLKPAPDGYLEAFRQLQADPLSSVILEDSNLGIEAGKASGAYVIGFRGNLTPGYEQKGAYAYADTMEDVIGILHKL